MKTVVDASAVIAMLLEEPGYEVVEDVIAESIISAVNLAEVVAALCARDNSPESVQAIVDRLAIPCVAADAALAVEAGLMRSVTASRGLSLGDRFCLALARRVGCPAITADKAWLHVAGAVGVDVQSIR